MSVRRVESNKSVSRNSTLSSLARVHAVNRITDKLQPSSKTTLHEIKDDLLKEIRKKTKETNWSWSFWKQISDNPPKYEVIVRKTVNSLLGFEEHKEKDYEGPTADKILNETLNTKCLYAISSSRPDFKFRLNDKDIEPSKRYRVFEQLFGTRTFRVFVSKEKLNGGKFTNTLQPLAVYEIVLTVCMKVENDNTFNWHQFKLTSKSKDSPKILMEWSAEIKTDVAYMTYKHEPETASMSPSPVMTYKHEPETASMSPSPVKYETDERVPQIPLTIETVSGNILKALNNKESTQIDNGTKWSKHNISNMYSSHEREGPGDPYGKFTLPPSNKITSKRYNLEAQKNSLRKNCIEMLVETVKRLYPGFVYGAENTGMDEPVNKEGIRVLGSFESSNDNKGLPKYDENTHAGTIEFSLYLIKDGIREPTSHPEMKELEHIDEFVLLLSFNIKGSSNFNWAQKSFQLDAKSPPPEIETSWEKKQITYNVKGIEHKETRILTNAELSKEMAMNWK